MPLFKSVLKYLFGMKKLVCIISLVLFFSCTVSAVSLRSIEVSKDEIRSGDSFYIEVELKSAESGHQLDFYVDDYLFQSFNVRYDKDTIKSAYWDWDSKELDCGEHVVRAELKRGNVSVENISMPLSVGNLPVVSFDPEKPLVGKTVTITLTDAKSKSPISGVKVEIYDPVSTKTASLSTDSLGRVTFKPDNYGKYSMTFSHRTYCGKKDFYARYKLTVDGPTPEDPVVGETICLALPGSIGVKVLDSQGDLYVTGETTIGGGCNFSVSEPGNYTIVIGELSTRYWGENKSLVVLDKSAPQITISPEKPVIGEPVTFNVAAGGAPLANAILTVTAPDNSFDTFTTSSSGAVSYTPVAIGLYGVIVEKERYQSEEKSFESKNKLSIDVYPSTPNVGEEVRFAIKNQMGNPVGDVSIMIDDEVLGSTDASGIYNRSFAATGTYKIRASKSTALYWDAEKQVTVSGKLQMSLSPEQVEVGEQSMVSVFNEAGVAVSAQLKATKPDGTQATLTGNTYEPSEPGDHSITASVSGYQEASQTLKVLPHPLNLEYVVSGNSLKVAVSSHGKPVPDIVVALASPYAAERVSDSGGVVYFDIDVEGEYVFAVNVQNVDADYESKTVPKRIVKSRRMILLIVPVVIIVVLAAAAVYMIYYVKGRRRGKGKKISTGKKKKDGALLEKGKKSSLSGA